MDQQAPVQNGNLKTSIVMIHGNGLIQREKWFPKNGLLERLSQKHALSIFTGRLRYEAEITLNRFAQNIHFDPIVCADDVAASKPNP